LYFDVKCEFGKYAGKSNNKFRQVVGDNFHKINFAQRNGDVLMNDFFVTLLLLLNTKR